MPMEPRNGILEGVFRRVQTRTWAGCTMIHGEENNYPHVPVLERGGVLIPLKRSPRDLAQRAQMQREARAWKWRSGYVGAGPPWVREEDEWYDPRAQEGSTLAVAGFWYPAFAAGTIQGWQIWGLSVDEPA